MVTMSSYRCPLCGTEYPLKARVWRCVCGSPLELTPEPRFAREDVDRGAGGVWRYAAALPPVEGRSRITLGEAGTPLVPAPWLGSDVSVKLEHLQPTGSYKDRGAAVTMSVLSAQGVDECVEDSSGNAAVAMAAYAAAAGIGCTVYAPASNSPAKLAQTRAHGAEVVLVHGDRQAVEAAVLERAGHTYYVGHNWHPLFMAGVSTLGIELVEQLGWAAPDTITVPVGYGNLLLGIWRGLTALERGGVLTRMPRLYGAQVDAYPAVARSWQAGASDVLATGGGPTAAEGIECRRPIRPAALLDALRRSGGGAVAVSEVETADALAELTSHGHYVEPTSAVALAGFHKLGLGGATGRHVIVLTGSGLKAAEAVDELLQDARRRSLAVTGSPS
jgi:threonine synthase